MFANLNGNIKLNQYNASDLCFPAAVSNSFLVIFEGTKHFKFRIVPNLSLPTHLQSTLLCSLQKLSSLKMYEINEGKRGLTSIEKRENNTENFVFESLWHVIFGKALVCIKASNFWRTESCLWRVTSRNPLSSLHHLGSCKARAETLVANGDRSYFLGILTCKDLWICDVF